MKQRRCIRITALLCAVNLLLLCPMASAESLSTEVVDLTVSANESIAALPQNIQSLLSNVKTGDVLVPTDNLYELTLKHADGSYTTEVYSVPVKYTDGEGEVQYIDTSMQSATLLDTLSFNRTYRNQGGYVDLAYKANITDGVVVDDAFTLSVPEQEDQQSAQQATQDDGSGKIVYPQAFGEHTYVEYINTYAGFKENIVLEQNIGQNTFDFVWESDTHIPVLIDDNKAIQIVSKTNPRQVDYTISPLYVYDSFDPTTSDDPYSHKHWTEDCRYDIIDQGDGVYTIRAIVSEEYLNHPETVYPVIIDPTVTADAAASNVEDGFVKESDKAGKYGTYNYLQFGYSGGRIYSYVKFFALPQLPVGAYFTSATFKVTFRTGQNTPADMKATAKTVEGDFDETTLTWNNKPTHKTTLSSVLPKITDGYLDYYNFTVTNGVREWYTNRNYGLVFTYQTETYADYNSVVSSEGDAARAPQLTINYTVPSSQTSGITNDGYYFIRNRSTGQYLTVNGTAVEQSTYDGGSAQLWKMHYYANGGYTLSAVATPNNCLYSAVDNNDGGVYSYLNPTTDADASAADINNSLMMIIPASSGYFRIASRSTGSFWALQADGTTVENYTYTGATNQQWAFEEYSLSLTPQSDWVIAGDMMRINTNNTAGLTLTWTSSNSSLAMVSNGTEYANFYGRSAGTVTVTATAENGDTASCTVEIIANALQTMTQGLSIEGTIVQGGEYWYKFTPVTSDTYTFTTTGSTDTRGELYQYLTPLASDDDSGAGFNFSISYYLEAGKTYRLKVRGYSTSTTGGYSVSLIGDDLNEPSDNEYSGATVAVMGQNVSDHKISYSTDVDWYKVSVPSSSDYRLRILLYKPDNDAGTDMVELKMGVYTGVNADTLVGAAICREYDERAASVTAQINDYTGNQWFYVKVESIWNEYSINNNYQLMFTYTDEPYGGEIYGWDYSGYKRKPTLNYRLADGMNDVWRVENGVSVTYADLFREAVERWNDADVKGDGTPMFGIDTSLSSPNVQAKSLPSGVNGLNMSPFMNIELNKDSFVNFSKDRAVDTICHELGHSLGLGDLYIDSSYGYTYTPVGSTEEKTLDNSDHLMFGFGSTRNLNGLGNIRFHSNDLFGVNMVQGWLDLEKYTKERLYSDADLIVRGRVAGTQNYSENEIRDERYTQVIFEVEEYLYSKANSTEKSLTFLQLGIPGMEFVVDPLYKVDEEYVLFLRYDLYGELFVVGGPQGRFQINEKEWDAKITNQMDLYIQNTMTVKPNRQKDFSVDLDSFVMTAKQYVTKMQKEAYTE